MNESNLQQAKAHVRESEILMERQQHLVRRLEEAGHYEAARTARELLATLTETLNASRSILNLKGRKRKNCSRAGTRRRVVPQRIRASPLRCHHSYDASKPKP
jgi:hypothetical protein